MGFLLNLNIEYMESTHTTHTRTRGLYNSNTNARTI